eukprot:TRINITY_DN17002_c0_g1_i10.p1 TRINITY_DN17002_c0_g1~~TRINITY_DN17002_c0_g1_i10.p1  ORF type:complete len:119 (-),score=30.11 TRINITY_DN17002_c0_g1_i10:126-482(-)
MGISARKRRAKKAKSNATVRRKAPKQSKFLTGITSQAAREMWNTNRTLRENFKNLGLAYSSNEVLRGIHLDCKKDADEVDIPEEDKSQLLTLLEVPEEVPRGPKETWNERKKDHQAFV